jgi:hypothetical protein
MRPSEEKRLVEEAQSIFNASLPQVSDPTLRFQIERVVGELEVAAVFKAAGTYANAKHLARYIKLRVAELRDSAYQDMELLRPALKLTEEFADAILSLPDTVATVAQSSYPVNSKKQALNTSGPYVARYPVGSLVTVVPLPDLTKFMETWTFHHKPVPEQLRFAGMTLRVKSVGFYHGGDPVYSLEHADSFLWLEPCLRPGPG